MPHITTCSRCARCYEEFSEEDANDPNRLCRHCWLGIRAPLRRDRAELDSSAAAQPPRPGLPGSRPLAFKGWGEEEGEGRPEGRPAVSNRAHRSALDPTQPWPFDRTQPESDRDWLRRAPEAPL